MKKSILLKLIIAITISGSSTVYGQTTCRTGFDNAAEKKDWVEFRKGKMGNANWTISEGGFAVLNRDVNNLSRGQILT